MGNFYTYIRPSETEYISFPDITIPISSIINFNNGTLPKALLMSFYDNNLFGYAQFTATVTVCPNIRFYNTNGAVGGIHPPHNKFVTPVATMYINYPSAPEDTNMEIPPKNNVYLNNKKQDDYNVGIASVPDSSVNGYTDPRIPITIVDFSPNGSNGADIYCNTPFTYNLSQLICLSPATNTEIYLSGFGYSSGGLLFYAHEGIRYNIDGTVKISNIKVYREKFIPPINSLGDL